MVYLDYAAATPMDGSVQVAMEPYFAEKFYNPSATYLPAKALKDEITAAKKSIAAHLGAKHSEIIHTSGGTEANNLAISGVMDNSAGKKVLLSAVEHESVLAPVEKYAHKLIPVDSRGIIRLEKLAKMITDDVVLISVILVNNEVGTIQPLREIAEIIKRRKKSHPIYLHTDACQAPCYLDINANRMGVDLLTLNGGKIYGPKGSGVLFVKSGVNLKPQILGGGQQRNLRSGTENAASIAGFARALDDGAKKRKDESERVGKLRASLAKGLTELNPGVKINGHPKKSSPHIISVTFPGVDNERLLFQLEDRGVLAASGSACSAASGQPSHVLEAMGISKADAHSSLRFSMGRQTNQNDIEYLLKILAGIIA